MTRCPACNAEIPAGSRFCDQCGAHLDGPPPSKGPTAIPLTRRKPRPEEPLPANERRAARRFPVRVEVSLHSEHNFYTGFSGNLSGGGLFVATHQPARVGELLDVTFTLPGLPGSCDATCEVRWLREHNPLAPDTVPGLGLRFVQLDPHARSCIERFVRQRDPIFFDDEW